MNIKKVLTGKYQQWFAAKAKAAYPDSTPTVVETNDHGQNKALLATLDKAIADAKARNSTT